MRVDIQYSASVILVHHIILVLRTIRGTQGCIVDTIQHASRLMAGEGDHQTSDIGVQHSQMRLMPCRMP